MRTRRLWILLCLLAVAGAVSLFSWREAVSATQAVKRARSGQPTMWMDSGSFSVSGPGGAYGLSESLYTHGDYVRWDTQFLCGPFDFTVPCRAWVAVLVLASLSVMMIGLAVVISFRMRKKARRTATG